MSQVYVSGDTRIIDLYKYCQTPWILSAKPGDEIHIITDTKQDPNVWQALAAGARAVGGIVTVTIMTPTEYHQAEPPACVAEAMKKADINMYATTGAFAHCKAAKRALEAGASYILSEEVCVENLTTGGATLTPDQWRKLHEFGEKIRQRFLAGNEVRVTSEYGTDVTCKIRDPKTGNVRSRPGHSAIIPGPGIGTAFPDGEVNVTPIPGTGEGTVVFDTSAHYPPGLLKDPIRLTIHKGYVTKVDGGREAEQLAAYIDQHGSLSDCECPTEIALGTNPKSFFTGIMRTDKKVYGGSHIALDGGGALHLDGIMRAPSIFVDGEAIVEKGVIKVGGGRPEL
jgi:leucyl aminopeptidase (aminopeptidase T)